MLLQDRRRGKVILIAHHDPSGQNSDASFEDAHIYVQFEAVYTFAVQDGLGKSDDRYVICAQKLFHILDLRRYSAFVHSHDGIPMSLDASAPKPHERLATALGSDMALVNDMIRQRMASEHAPRIPQVTAHLIEAGGKRLRPMLTLAAARMCGYDGPYHIHLAATVEFIHTATLLHDDVVDQSEQRRGRPTANLLWDNTSSVLVGDYLFARSFQLMVEPGSLRVLDILANAAATIAEGEVLQLTAAQDLSTTEETYLKVVRGKTAALFSAATEVGGVIAGVEEAQIKALYAYGDALGIAFQMVDDVIDYGDPEVTGKNAGDDFRERKLTLPLIKALAQATPEERVFWDRTIAKGKQEDGDLDQVFAILARTGALEAVTAEALGWASKAKAALEDLPDHPIRHMLADLADYVVSRIS